MSIKTYLHKRNFKVTTEPKGSVKKKTASHIYVMHKHYASHLHYDLRLEMDGVLKSWAVPKGPSLDPSIKRLAVHVEDHPIEYGQYEGSIPKGEYGAGKVIIWDTGDWSSRHAKQDYKNGHLTFELRGKKLKGVWNLIRIKNDDRQWLLIKAKDKWAKSQHQYDVTIEEPESINE